MPAPKDPIKKELWKRRMSQARKGRPAWNKGRVMSVEFREKMAKLSLKFWYDPAFQGKIAERNRKVALAKMGDKNPMKRPEVSQKVRLAKLGTWRGDKNPMRNPKVREKISILLKGHIVAQETREKIRENLRGRFAGELNPFYGKHHSDEVKEKSRVRAISQIASGILSSRRTSIEIKVAEELVKRKIKFIEQYPIADITVADFYLPEHNVVIYCDGDFWHKSEWARKNKVIGKDIAINRYLKNARYQVFRFSESEINFSVTDCIKKVQAYLGATARNSL